MRKIRTFESFWVPGSQKVQDDSDEEALDRLAYMLEEIKPTIIQNFDNKGMEVDFLEIDDPTEFIIEIFPKSYDGRIPKKISYYLDEISELFSKFFKVRVDWDFSPNGNVQRIIFSLDKEIDPKRSQIVKTLKMS